MLEQLTGKKIILASKSPRRRQLLEGLGIKFEVLVHEIDEDFPEALRAEEIPLFLAKAKADAFANELTPEEIVITADTIVWINGQVMNKPASKTEAFHMLSELSGRTHEVYTGVCIRSMERAELFYDKTEVKFSKLSNDEIEYYIETYAPYDKAGSYGAQDWIGLVGIQSLNGSYFNVMGLPVHLVYEKLKTF